MLFLDYPGYPILLKFSPRTRSLTWMASTQESGRKSFFVIQYLLNRNKCKWMDVNRTSGLSISTNYLSEYLPEGTLRTCSVRVCFEAGKKSVNKTCSSEHKLYSSKRIRVRNSKIL